MTTATITADSIVDDELADIIILDAMLAKWTDGDDKLAQHIALELKMDLLFGSYDPTIGRRRANPKTRAMRRNGQRYQVRKDHGTTSRYKEIAAENTRRNSRQKGSNAQKRRAAKLADYSGNPRVIAKLMKLGDLLVD